MCRSAEAAGAAGVVIPSRRSAAVTAVACKASAGAVEHLPVARVTNLVAWLTTAKDAGAWIYGAEQAAPAPYAQADLSGKVVLVLGSEGRGLRRRVSETCDLLISIPVRGRVASLNVSAAAAVLLFEADAPARAGWARSLATPADGGRLLQRIVHRRAEVVDRTPPGCVVWRIRVN